MRQEQAQRKPGYRDLFSERNYMRNFLANIINRFGDSIDALAFAWMVYEVTGDPSWSAIVLGMNTLPTVLLMPLAGVIVERYDKRVMMVIADVGRAVLVALIAALYMTGLVRPWMLAAGTFLLSTFEAFRVPAGLALFPKLVPREKYALATSFNKSMGSVCQILGSAAFGIVVAAIGLEGAMFIDAATFLISAALVHSIRLPRDVAQRVKLSVQSFFVELKEGFSYMYSRRVIFMVCMIGALLNLVVAPLNALEAPYIQDVLGQGEMALSTLSIAMMVGTMIGTVAYPWLNRRIAKAALFTAGGVLAALGYFGFVVIGGIGSVAGLYVALALCSGLFGLGVAQVSMVINVAFMEQIEPSYMGRVGSIFNSMGSALIPVSSFVVAGMAKFLTVPQLFAIFSAVMALAFIALSLSKTFRSIDTPAVPEGEVS